MTVLVKLSSRLISELLCCCINQDEHQIFAANERSSSFMPDIVLVDHNNLDQKLISQYSGAKIILIDTGLKREDVINYLLSYKIDGVISTNTDINLFKKALKVVHDGQFWMENFNIKELVYSAGLISKGAEDISRREEEIIDLICQGYTNKEIASRLDLSEQTVKTHLSRIFRKFNVSNRSQLIALILKKQNGRLF